MQAQRRRIVAGADGALHLWAAKDIQDTFLPDIKKLEKMLESRFPEPIRSGLDPRSAHIVLIKRRYEYEKWIRAMFDVLEGPQYQHANGLTHRSS